LPLSFDCELRDPDTGLLDVENRRVDAPYLLSQFHVADAPKNRSLVMAIESHPNNEVPAGPLLTVRELEVLKLLTQGATNSEISDRLLISPKTTQNHLTAIFRKLESKNRTQAALRAMALGLAKPD
jgi:DNA-binding CsgD family transcriptional regulator